jgi:hypothetical protein
MARFQENTGTVFCFGGDGLYKFVSKSPLPSLLPASLTANADDVGDEPTGTRHWMGAAWIQEWGTLRGTSRSPQRVGGEWAAETGRARRGCMATLGMGWRWRNRSKKVGQRGRTDVSEARIPKQASPQSIGDSASDHQGTLEPGAYFLPSFHLSGVEGLPQLVEGRRTDSCDDKLHMSDVDTGCDNLDSLIVRVADEGVFFFSQRVKLS